MSRREKQIGAEKERKTTSQSLASLLLGLGCAQQRWRERDASIGIAEEHGWVNGG